MANALVSGLSRAHMRDRQAVAPISEITVVAMGPSQLLTAAAALKQEFGSWQRAQVLYRGVEAPGIDEALQRICGALGLSWGGILAGNFAVASRSGVTGMIDRGRARLSQNDYLRQRLGSEVDPLAQLSGRIVIIALRHAQQEDSFLLAAAKPKEVIYVADGVIVGAPAHCSVGPAERRALGAFVRDYPLNDRIFTPRYLEKHARKVAQPILLDDAILNSVFADAGLASATVAEFEHVIVSQHLAVSRLATELEELRIWSDVVRFVAGRHPAERILFKPHPRDRAMKVALLRGMLDAAVRLVEPKASQRAEPLETMDLARDTWIYGLSSSALLYAAKHAGRNVAVLNARYWPTELTAEISSFAAEADLPMLWIDG